MPYAFITAELGIDYDFRDTWGVSRTTFEVFTLGTLAVVVGVAVLGYLWRRLRDGSGTAATETASD